MTRGATLFSGGGGVEALLKERINFVHAVEYDPAIAAVYRANHGDHVQVASVCDVDYAAWGALDYLHASPVCKEFSQAKTGGTEGENDIQTALAVVRCLEETQPRVFTLENVGAYQHSKSYKLICRALDLAGYMWHAEVLNSADFGVPQTRRRLILRAVRDALLPGLAAPERWVGWYEAIEDIIDTLPASQFAPWQMARLPSILSTSLIDCTHRTDADLTVRSLEAPAHTIASSHFRRPGNEPRAFILSNAATEYGDGIRSAAEPCHSITAQADGRTRPPLVASADEPMWTVRAASYKGYARAWLSAGRVVKMTPRALARFQSLPDSYQLPDKSSLACTVIGNMVPSLMMQKIVEPLL
jgi:DNA (cytosine-5)-methyltransferase 1